MWLISGIRERAKQKARLAYFRKMLPLARATLRLLRLEEDYRYAGNDYKKARRLMADIMKARIEVQRLDRS